MFALHLNGVWKMLVINTNFNYCLTISSQLVTLLVDTNALISKKNMIFSKVWIVKSNQRIFQRIIKGGVDSPYWFSVILPSGSFFSYFHQRYKLVTCLNEYRAKFPNVLRELWKSLKLALFCNNFQKVIRSRTSFFWNFHLLSKLAHIFQFISF